MSAILQTRADIIKRINIMIRRIDGVTSFILTGSRRCPPSDIHVVIGASDKSTLNRIYNDIDFLIGEFLSPSASNYIETDGRIVKNYSFESGVGAEVTICGEDNFPHADWWVSYLDKNCAALAFYGVASKCNSDPVSDDLDDFEDDLSDDFEDDFEDDFQDDKTVSQPIAVPPVMFVPSNPEKSPAVEILTNDNLDDSAVGEKSGKSEPKSESKLEPAPEPKSEPRPEPAPEPKSEPRPKPAPEQKSEPSSEQQQSADEIWEHVYSRVSLAKRAIGGGSVIHAGEIINELRTQLIKLICEQSGIKGNYIYSIDLLSNDYQKELLKTYPAKLESSEMISALAAELSLFEQLIK